MSISTSQITAVVLTMEGPYEILRASVESAVRECASVVVADNQTVNAIQDLERVEAEFPSATFVRFDRNYGFAGGINRAMASVQTPFVLLLNNDAVLNEGAAAKMLETLEGLPLAAGVAPKMIFADDQLIIDSVGTCVDEVGRSVNRGLGQPDIGQYDTVEQVAGLCFGAALLRTALFEADHVGPMAEKYFLYYEDVDWCLRAGALGWRFYSSPEAVVTHRHSFTTRQQGLEFRYGYAERNMIWTSIRDVDGFKTIRFAFGQMLSHLSCVLRGRPYPGASRRVLVDTIRTSPWLLKSRRELNSRRKVAHAEIASLCAEGPSWFDAAAFKPKYDAGALRDAYARRFLNTGSAEAGNLASMASRLDDLTDHEIKAALSGHDDDEVAYWIRLARAGRVD